MIDWNLDIGGWRLDCQAFQLRRTIQLPADVDMEKIEASYENGVLTLTLPKAEEVKPKTIKVKAK